MRWGYIGSIGDPEIDGEIKIYSSLDQLEHFIVGPVWKDMQESISSHIGERLEALKKAENIDQIRILQGEVSAFEQVLNLPQVLRDLKEELTKDEGDQNEQA